MKPLVCMFLKASKFSGFLNMIRGNLSLSADAISPELNTQFLPVISRKITTPERYSFPCFFFFLLIYCRRSRFMGSQKIHPQDGSRDSCKQKGTNKCLSTETQVFCNCPPWQNRLTVHHRPKAALSATNRICEALHWLTHPYQQEIVSCLPGLLVL